MSIVQCKYIYEWLKSQHLFDFTCSQAPRSPTSKQAAYLQIYWVLSHWNGIGDYSVIRFEIIVIMSFHTSTINIDIQFCKYRGTF